MKSEIKKRGNPNTKKYKKDELDIALDFSKQAHKEFGNVIKGIVLFGSKARNIAASKNSDIDLLIVLDDVGIELTKELVEAYHIIGTKLVAKISPRIHITTLKYSTFWSYVRDGDPIGINILRDGVALLDTGFFDPLQALLYRGQIKPTYESTWRYYNRSIESLGQSRLRLVDATMGLYWAVIDSAQAALMRVGAVPPTPEKTGSYIKEYLVKKNLCTKRHADTMDLFYGLQKEITYRKIQDISGQEYEKYYGRAKDFVEKMKKVIESL